MKNLLLIFLGLGIIACGSNPPVKSLEPNGSDLKAKGLSLQSGILENYDSKSQLGQESLEADSTIRNLDELGYLLKLCNEADNNTAMDYLKKLAPTYRKKAPFWNVRGICEYRWGKFDLAELSWRKSLQLDSKFAPVYNNLGILFLNKGEINQALDAFKKANSLSRFAFTPLYNMAILYIGHGHAQKALEILRGLDLGSGNDSKINATLGVAQLMSGNSKKAVDYFSKVESGLLNNPNWGLNYAYALYLEGDYEKSRKVLAVVNWNTGDDMVEYYKGLMFLLGKKV